MTETEQKTDVVLYEVSDGIAKITFNRPDRLNAYTPELGSAYFDRLQEAADSDDVRVIIVTGAGRGWCAGADMTILQGEQDSSPRDPRPHSFPLQIPKPVIAAINGAAAGLGLVMAMMCDVRFAAAGAKFTTAFSRRGLVAEHGISWMLPRLIGPSRALDLLFSARVILAEEAAELGIVNRVFAGESLLDDSYAYARDLIANCSPAAMAVMKRQVYDAYGETLEAATNRANRLMVESFSRPDFREGVTSYVEKRQPEFPPVPKDLAY